MRIELYENKVAITVSPEYENVLEGLSVNTDRLPGRPPAKGRVVFYPEQVNWGQVTRLSQHVSGNRPRAGKSSNDVLAGWRRQARAEEFRRKREIQADLEELL